MTLFPAWRQVDARPGEVVAPDKRLPWPQRLVAPVAALTLVPGTGDHTLRFGDFALGGIGTATLGAIVLYALPGRRDPR